MIAPRTLFIAGPTASGKSAAALEIASRADGEIVNADAIQVYRDLRVLSARPTVEDEARLTHHLYGFLDGAERCSAGRWARLAAAAIADIHERGSLAVVVGGTGFYFRALEEGLSPVPDIPASVRAEAGDRLAEIGAEAFRDEVIADDPAMARLPAGDSQRLMRAWEVHRATGKPLSYFQGLPREPLLAGVPAKAVIEPPRERLYERCEERAESMLKKGGLDEARALIARKLDPGMPIMKALGVPEIADHLAGAASLEETLDALKQSTRRFAKRQLTWLRRQTPDWPRFASAREAIKIL